jgi:hypothetical protein
MRQKAQSWPAFDIRMMFQGYLERGFAAGEGDVEAQTALLGHAPRRYCSGNGSRMAEEINIVFPFDHP